jgi:hypothetical protein
MVCADPDVAVPPLKLFREWHAEHAAPRLGLVRLRGIWLAATAFGLPLANLPCCGILKSRCRKDLIDRPLRIAGADALRDLPQCSWCVSVPASVFGDLQILWFWNELLMLRGAHRRPERQR